MGAFIRDLRFAIRTLVRNPGFSVAIIVTLALGIGANTGMFSVVYGILLRPLPYERPDRLVMVEAERDVSGVSEPVRAYFWLADLDVLRRMPSFESVALYATDQGVLSIDERTEAIEFATVSDSFFSTLQGAFKLGRGVDGSDASLPSLVISERLWRGAFAASPDVVGRTVVLNSTRGDGSQRAAWRRVPFTIVGVAAQSVQFPGRQIDAWTTAGYVRTVVPRCCSFSSIARLHEGTSIAQANLQTANLNRALGAAADRGSNDLRTRIVGLHDSLVRLVRSSLVMLFATVGLFLCVTCANVMNLLVVRHTRRARELAVRLALGASRRQLVAQSVIETGVLAAAGGVVGVLVAIGLVQVLRWLRPTDIPRLDAVHVDLPTLTFTFVVVLLTTVLTGLAPAWQATKAEALRVGGAGASQSVSGTRMRRLLTIGELAVSVVLLVGALLLGRSLIRLLHTDLGIEVDHVVTASLGLSMNRDLSGAEQVGVVNRLLDDIGPLPGVTVAGIGTVLPPSESRIVLTLRGTSGIGYQAAAIPATPGYFPALGIRLLKGRFFTDADDENHPAVMIMSAATARHFFGDGEPLGRTLSLPVFRDGKSRNADMTLVGIIADVKYSGLERPADNSILRPFAQQPWPNVYLIVRTKGEPGGLVPTIQRRIAQLDPAIVVSKASTLDAVVLDAAAQPRLRSVLTAGLAGLTLALAIVGLYGVISRSVSERANEIGIRMALGASSANIVRMVVAEGLTLAIAGIALGVVISSLAVRLLATLLYGVTPTDPMSFGAAATSLLVFALIASYVPARKASRIDPAVALRGE